MLQVITLVSVAVLVAVDQIIKLLVLEHLKPIGSFPLIDDIIQLNYAENTGAAFGSFGAHTNLLSIFTFVLIVIGFVYLYKYLAQVLDNFYNFVKTSIYPLNKKQGCHERQP